MKCSLKGGFINILLFVFITSTEGIQFPLFLQKSSVLDKRINLKQYRATINRLQDLDSFPGNVQNQLHRIVKKQMATYKDPKKYKRSVIEFPGKPLGYRCGTGDVLNMKCKDGKTERTESNSFLRKLKEFAKDKEFLFLTRNNKNDPTKNTDCGLSTHEIIAKKQKEVEEMLKRLKEKLTAVAGLKEKDAKKIKEEKDQLSENSYLSKAYARFPDQHDYRFYYECESHPNGCLKLRHKRCPKGQFFSFKYLKCLKARSGKFRSKKSSEPQKNPGTIPDEPEPSNEWLDLTQGGNQKIPSEFKPIKKPTLKIYHLRPKRKQDESLARVGLGSSKLQQTTDKRGVIMKHECRNDLPRSYVISVKKKEGKEQLTENDENENDNDEEDEETDEEDEDEEADEEDDDSEEEDNKDGVKEKPGARESLREFLKSAKAAVTKRARFEEPVEFTGSSALAPKESVGEKCNTTEGKENKVLIDANIKFDSTISSVVKNFLKGKSRDNDANSRLMDKEALTSLRSRDQMGLEVTDMYDNLMQNNPRVKRYFKENCTRRGMQLTRPQKKMND